MAAKGKQQQSGEQSEDRETGSERSCVVTRASLDPGQLIRFARAPDGVLVPDLDRALPGRGVWVTCDRKILEKAISSKAFAKGLKSQVEIPGDLVARVDMLLKRRAVDALSLANKAGRLVAGFQQVDASLEKGHVAAIVHGADAAHDGRGKLDRKFQAIQRERGQPAPIVNVLTIAEMSLAMGRPSVVHAALIPGGLTERFLREAERVLRFRSCSGATDQDFSDADQMKVERTPHDGF